MDDTDRASDLEERQRQEAISRRKHVLEHDGFCINCGNESAGAYCDIYCKEDAERFDRAAERDGRRPGNK